MVKVSALKCRECGEESPVAPNHVCDNCFGPLEVVMNWAEIAPRVTRQTIECGPRSMWRYKQLLPVEGEPFVGGHVGFTPLVRARRLGESLGLRRLYVKNDAVNHPTLSFKDRVVSVALTKAHEFGFDTVACASTGNLANSVAAHAAEGGFQANIFIPNDLEAGKVLGTLVYGARLFAVAGNYDDVNRMCAEAVGRYPWAFVNVNMRTYYGDGSKTVGYEIAEQLGWRAPDHVVAPCAGGSLISKIYKGLHEFSRLGLLENTVNTRMYAAQATGCSPITTAVKAGWEVFKPQKPATIARSIAIGNPADGLLAIETVRKSGGWADDVTDDEVVEGMELLAHTEGIFTETAGGVTVAVARKLAKQHRFHEDDVVVLAITGNGLKVQEVMEGRLATPRQIEPNLKSLDAALSSDTREHALAGTAPGSRSN